MGKVEMDENESTNAKPRLVTIGRMLRSTSNDYTHLESLFRNATGHELVTDRPLPGYILHLFENQRPSLSASIVIPLRNLKAQFIRCIASISSQSFTTNFPHSLQLVVFEDGRVSNQDNPLGSDARDLLDEISSQRHVRCDILSSRDNLGRANARNIGLSLATGDVIFLIDSGHVLDQGFLMEHMVRHEFISNLALVGFKQNIDDFVSDRRFDLDRILAGNLPTVDISGDWKLGNKRASRDFEYQGKRHFANETPVNFMELTNSFKNWPTTEAIDDRYLPSVSQTNLASVRREHIYRVGGFSPLFHGWGFEDTHLGALLLAAGCYLVPCPSSSAFNLEHQQPCSKKAQAKSNEELFNDLLSQPYRERWGELHRIASEFRHRSDGKAHYRFERKDSLDVTSMQLGGRFIPPFIAMEIAESAQENILRQILAAVGAYATGRLIVDKVLKPLARRLGIPLA